MWAVTIQLVTISGKRVHISFETKTRQEAVDILKRMGLKFKPTDFFGLSEYSEEAEAMFMGKRECIWLQRRAEEPC